MLRLVVLGGGTGGTILANRAARMLPADWKITLVDPGAMHVYGPGLLYVPFGADERRIQRRREKTLASRVAWTRQAAVRLDVARRAVELADGTSLGYDRLVVATGSEPRPERIEGLAGPAWGKTIFDFHGLESALALRRLLPSLEWHRLVVCVSDATARYPLSACELLFLLADWLEERRRRDEVELALVIPSGLKSPGRETDVRLGELLAERGILVEDEFRLDRVEPVLRFLHAGERTPFLYDYLVCLPPCGGARFLDGSGITDARGFVRVDPRTLAARDAERVYALGDATDLPIKSGSVAHYQAEALAENLALIAAGEEPLPLYDGHASWFVETGGGKALFADFDYDSEANGESGRESRKHHWLNQAFGWVYWHGLLPGRPLPLTTRRR